jgi:hypothetical protein
LNGDGGKLHLGDRRHRQKLVGDHSCQRDGHCQKSSAGGSLNERRRNAHRSAGDLPRITEFGGSHRNPRIPGCLRVSGKGIRRLLGDRVVPRWGQFSEDVRDDTGGPIRWRTAQFGANARKCGPVHRAGGSPETQLEQFLAKY